MGRGRVRRGQRAIAKRQTTPETETIFKTVVVDGQSNVIADQKADRLTLEYCFNHKCFDRYHNDHWQRYLCT